jgi:hypothetical protein
MSKSKIETISKQKQKNIRDKKRLLFGILANGTNNAHNLYVLEMLFTSYQFQLIACSLNLLLLDSGSNGAAIAMFERDREFFSA